MAKNTKPIAGQSQRKYFRDLFRTDPGVTPDAVERLTEACVKELAQIRVRLPMVVRRPMKVLVADTPANKPAETQPAAKSQAAAFDPHAFSLIVVMRKGGKDALLAKLAEVTDLTQLMAIAKAQHVALDGQPASRDDVLEALVAGTERRIAHREAAAS